MKKLLAALVLCSACRLAPPLLPTKKPAQARYTLLRAGHPAGVQTTVRDDKGIGDYTFEFNDRGRGPKLTRRDRIDSAGLVRSEDTTGVDYYKAPVDEHFAWDGTLARWKSKSESGEQRTDGAFFSSLWGVPEETGLLANALRHAAGGKLALLPAGEARLTRVSAMEVEAKGEKKKVVQYAISGLDLSPTRVWLDEEGNYFASADTWSQVVLEGWEETAPRLLAAQEEAEAVRNEKLARELVRRPPGKLAFVHAAVFDAEHARTLADQTVVVAGDRIESVGAGLVPPAGAEVVDARGKTLLPGLWDMHVHYDDGTSGLLLLAGGVTSVRHLGGGDPDSALARKRSYDEGRAIGPRMLLAGLVDGPGPFAGPTKLLVATEAEARATVASLADRGFVQLKIYSSVDPKLVPAMVDEAHKRGLRVSGHVPQGMTAADAVRAGFDELQHANFLFLNFLGDKVKDTRSPERFTAVAENAALLDLDSQPVRDFVQLLAQRHTTLDPTLDAFEGKFLDRPGVVDRVLAPVAQRLPAQVQRGLFAGGLPVPEGMDQRYRDSFKAMEKMVALMDRAGVPIVAGTDAELAGFTLHRELELYVESGLAPAHVLQLATLGAARTMRRERELGSISPGKLADLVLVDGDPAARISDVRKTALVLKDGAVYEPRKLYDAASVR